MPRTNMLAYDASVHGQQLVVVVVSELDNFRHFFGVFPLYESSGK